MRYIYRESLRFYLLRIYLLGFGNLYFLFCGYHRSFLSCWPGRRATYSIGSSCRSFLLTRERPPARFTLLRAPPNLLKTCRLLLPIPPYHSTRWNASQQLPDIWHYRRGFPRRQRAILVLQTHRGTRRRSLAFRCRCRCRCLPLHAP